jgi:hypothetical protein
MGAFSTAAISNCTTAENHGRAVALCFMYCNFCCIHQTLRVTPAMEAGISDHVWRVEELAALLDSVR